MKQLPIRQHIRDYPVVVVHNYLESFRSFFSRTGDDTILFDRRFNGDQALYWMGNDKLVITSVPITDAAVLCKRWGYTQTKTLAPKNMTASLSQDILEEQELLEAILAQAGDAKKVAMISYAATPEFLHLAETLTKQYGLDVLLPECPTPERLWVKDYLDSKVGFRNLFPQWTHDDDRHKYPEGFICDNLDNVAEMVHWFRENGKGCVIKASQGGSGVGNLFMPLKDIPDTVVKIYEHLCSNIFLVQDLYVVEELIDSPTKESPSAEVYIPPLEAGPPIMTYLCMQHFESSGRFAGVLIGSEMEDKTWYPKYVDTEMFIAGEMQKMGYVGYFDMDSIIDEHNDVYMVEINARRTGGTYAHEFMEFVFGPEYFNRIAMLAHNKFDSGRLRTLPELEEAIADLLYPIKGEERGVIVLLTSTLSQGKFGFLVVGDTLAETISLRAQMSERIHQAV
ncbi:MAG TPA: hypothetical protein VJ965_11900 [Anaerolineales bacterium]|nr:hypothetical protein [Anaerolineales bacterium]